MGVRGSYVPLDEVIAWGRPEVSPLAITDNYDQVVSEPAPGVFVFPFLSEDLCARIWAESEHYLTQATRSNLPVPVRHDGCLDLSHVFPALLSALADAVMPAIRV